MEDYDYIFAGGGCAGLSLLHYLLESSLKPSKILVIEPFQNERPNKTWCYWDTKPLAIHPKEYVHFWKNFSLQSEKRHLVSTFKKLHYFHLNSVDFYSSLEEKFNGDPRITWLKDQVTHINETSDNVEVITENSGNYRSNFVFDSRIVSTEPQSQPLKQVFVGWKITAEENVFEPNKITLMDYRTQSGEGFDFAYILPFSEKEALVEYTAYSKEAISVENLEYNLSKYLEKILSGNPYKITYKEAGSIPMTTKSKPLAFGKRIIPIGTNAGWTKPSTGYTFYQIQINCQRIVKGLETNDYSSLVVSPKNRFKFYDNILLNIAHLWPEKLKEVFFDIFSKTSPDIAFRFLSEQTSLLEELTILGKLKYHIFIKSLFNYASR
jgi:lycopene beta-cyclase